MIEVQCNCPFCGAEEIVEVEAKGFAAWQSGALIQEALPSLSEGQRERLLTGICDPCWNGSFGEADDELDDDEVVELEEWL